MLECGHGGKVGPGERGWVLGCESGFYSGSTWRDWGAPGPLLPPSHLQTYYEDSGKFMDVCRWHLGRGMMATWRK